MRLTAEAPGTDTRTMDISAPDGRAVGARAFADLMRPLGPFEAAPTLAVAVSGGADSMALALLAAAWSGRRGGRAIALTVEHGLRPGSAAEARQVREWLADHAIAHHILRWRGPKPTAGMQAAARRARYDLLSAWCRRHGCLHLLTAHHRNDQAETLAMRLRRGTGVEGLAGMPAVRALPGVRLLRPLLSHSRADLIATLAKRRQAWLEDPSNQNPVFARIRERRYLRAVDDDDATTANLLRLADEAASLRQTIEAAVADLAASAVSLHPAGFCLLDPRACRGAGSALTSRLLAQVLVSIGGGDFRPRRDRLHPLCDAVFNGGLEAGRTLAGCRLLPYRGRLLICREPGRLPAALTIQDGRPRRWDRFKVWLDADAGDGCLWVGALGADGWRQVRDRTAIRLPGPVPPSLPALRLGDRVLAVPHLGPLAGEPAGIPQFAAQFAPPRALNENGLAVVRAVV
ncbi:MAG: tRNA lysidine(34) synthetase TilS [Alphaproteobacteria bacterium]|nr:tRNA lysidine(34) synthetase TilS [Alphaproteobacteria bacterium]MDP6564297.1 tRNA lysidine(34) synthetase TilS [Alphaproteobacteria bacterium]MDP6811836.1 tRNA lysidine(34) synthetase TilS [Alphaproteobacteria bacterium]